MLNTPKKLIVQGRKATRPNSFLLHVFFFTASFLNFLTSLHLNEFVFLTPFSPFLKITFPQTCHFLSFMYSVLSFGQIRVLYCRILFKEGNWLLICWLTMRLVIGSNKELLYMLMHIIGAGFERLKLLRIT